MALHRHRHQGLPSPALRKGRVGVHRRRPASAIDIARRLVAVAASSGTTHLLSPVNGPFSPIVHDGMSISPIAPTGPQICCPWSFLDPLMPKAPPAKKTQSFASIVGDAVAPLHSSLPIPEIRGDKVFVKISEDLYKEQLNLFQTNLIGRLLLRRGSVPLRTNALKASLDALWNPSKSWRLVPLGRGFFDIHFDSEVDMKRIWNCGTWVLTGGIFRLSEWKPDFKPEEALSQSHSQVWIRISGLSQDYWHPRILMEIANGIGTPLQIDKATKDRQFGYYARILVDIDLSKDHPTSLMVERGNHVFSVAIDYETSLDKHVQAREKPKSRSWKRGHLSDRSVGEPQRQEYRVKAVIDQQGLEKTHGKTPLVDPHVVASEPREDHCHAITEFVPQENIGEVATHVEAVNRFAILASEPCEDHVITEPITVPQENIGEVATNINVLAEYVPTYSIGSASVDPQPPKFCWGDLENEAPLGHSTESDFDSNFDNSWLDEVNTNLDEEKLLQSIPKIRPKKLKNKQEQMSSRHSARPRMPVVRLNL